jgi:chemotaxis signal transduction protein
MYVTFLLGGGLYGLPAASVCEVVQPLPTTPLPNAPENLVGIAALRGQIIAVVNVQRALGLETEGAEKSKMVVVRSLNEQIPLGLPVERMSEVIFIDDAALEKRGELPDFVISEGSAPAGPLRILDPESLVKALTVV